MKQPKEYQSVEDLRDLLVSSLSGKAFTLDCGHKVTMMHGLGANVVIINGKRPKLICTMCAY